MEKFRVEMENRRKSAIIKARFEGGEEAKAEFDKALGSVRLPQRQP